MSAVPARSRSTLDRASACRQDEAWLARAWADPGSRVLVVDGDRAPVTRTALGAGLAFVPPAQAPPGDRLLLGVEDGRTYWAVAGPPGPDVRTADLRAVGALLDEPVGATH